MKSFLSKIKLPTSVRERNTFNLSCDHYTTHDFFKIKPVYVHECMPGESIEINMQTFSRTVALRKPFYGKVEYINRAFFVPLRLVMNDFTEFKTDTKMGLLQRNFVPYLLNEDLVNLFLDNELAVDAASSTADFDFYVQISEVPYHKKFTNKGRIFYDILRNLGYHINFADSSTNRIDTDKLSALPLLCFIKMFEDWMINAAYSGNHTSNYKYDGEAHVVHTSIKSMLNRVTNALYEKDYFTTSWLKPVGPNTTSLTPNVQFDDLTNEYSNSYGQSIVSTKNANAGGSLTNPTTPNVHGTAGSTTNPQRNSPYNLTQYALDRLKQLTDYVKRFQMIGERAVDRYKALFGIQLDAAKVNRSVFLGTNSFTMNIGEVMVTSDTEGPDGNTLGTTGDYTGKSNGYGEGTFKFSTDEFGFLFIVSIVRPHVGYVQGRPRYLQHINRLDFFTPDFDRCGVQPIRMDELFADGFKTLPSGWKPSNVFGFTDQYAEYKCQPHDFLSGDMVLESRNEGLDAWHLMRLMDPNTPAVNGEEFTIGDGSQFDRVFNYQESDYDHFITIYHFDVKASLPAAKFMDNYDFDGGKLIDAEIGGTSLD